MNTAIILAAGLSDSCTAETESIFSGLANWAVWLVESMGGIGIALAMGLETAIPMIPSEIILPLIGASSSVGEKFNFAEAIIWSMLGVMLGAWIIYAISRAIGLERVKWLFGKIPFFNTEDIDKANNWFMSKGYIGVLLGRFVPIVRTFVSIPAGVGKMNFWVFTALTFIGSLIWNVALMSAGYFLGSNWCAVDGFMANFTYLVAIIILALIALYIYIKIKSKKASPPVIASEQSERGNPENPNDPAVIASEQSERGNPENLGDK